MKTNRSRRSVKWKIFGYFSLYALIMLILLWFLQTVFLYSFYTNSKINEIRQLGSRIQEILPEEDAYEQLEELARTQQICIHLLQADGTPLFQAGMLFGCPIHRMEAEDIRILYQEAKANDGSYLEKWNDGSAPDFAPNLSARPLPADDRRAEHITYGVTLQIEGTEAILLLNTTISPVDATVETLRRLLLHITGILLLLGFSLALLASWRIGKPIQQINQTAGELAKGDYTVRFAGGGYREITELSDTLNYAAAELNKVESLQRELIANVSHDLRTPLTMITAYAETMRDLPGETTPQNIQVIIEEARRLDSLVNDLLNIGRLQSGAQELFLSTYSLTEKIGDILTRYEQLVDRDGYIIRFFHEGDARITADALKISQVIYNLVNNAVSYTGEDKKISIRQVVANRHVTIRVEDTGPGVKQEDLPYIWNRYYRSIEAHKRASVGTGLGLSIVKEVLELHGFPYGVENGEKGGAVFWFSAPITQEKYPSTL